MYRLQAEVWRIPNVSMFTVEDLQNETDEQCLQFVVQLIEKMRDVNWTLLIGNDFLLNHFIDQMYAFGTLADLRSAVVKNGLTDENLVKILPRVQDCDEVDDVLAKRPQIWRALRLETVERVTKRQVVTDAMFISQFPQFFHSIECISPRSSNSDIADVVCLIGSPSDIPSIVKKFPGAVIGAIENWDKSPKTDWFCDALKDNLPMFLDEAPDTVLLAVPEDAKESVSGLIDNMIIEKIRNEEDVHPGLWKFAALGDDLMSLLISSKFDVKAPQETKDYVYKKLYSVIESTRNNAAAGALIGRISSSSQIDLEDFPKSYDFLENFFNEVEIKNVPEPVAVSFLDEYLSKKFPNFEVTLYSSAFDTEKMSPAVKQFLATISSNKRESVLQEALNSDHFRVALLLAVTTDESLDLPADARFAPYLCELEEYKVWFDQTKFGEMQPFVDFLHNKETAVVILPSSNPMALFVTAESKLLESRYVYEVIEQGLQNPSTINWFLIILSFLNIEQDFSVFPDLFLALLRQIPSAGHISELSLEKLSLLFQETAKMTLDQLNSFLSKAALVMKGDVLHCLQDTMPLYIAKLSETELLNMRMAMSKGSTWSLSVFDTAIAQTKEFFDPRKSNFTSLITSLPNAAAKWFSANPCERVRGIVMRDVTPNLVARTISETVEAMPKGVTSKHGNDWIECECQDDDDLFKLRVSFPNDYPLRPVQFDVSSVGTEQITRECKDEVYSEAIRPSGPACAIAAWNSRIMNLVASTNACPICLSLLDEHSELPRARCFTCHQFCHRSCVKPWLADSTKRNTCPWCRGPFKRPKTTPKKKQ